ncbi:MAG: penicillin-insensitive murein endopeptidase [Myxococcota bacterium]
MSRILTIAALLVFVWPRPAAAGTDEQRRVATSADLPDSAELKAVVSGRAARASTGRAELGMEAPDLPDWRIDPEEMQSRSVGPPNDGRLEHGVPLPRKGTGFVRYARDTQYGTDETVAIIRWVAAHLVAAYPGTAPMLVGDISREGGGRLHPHSSHQTGRDVDIGFFEESNDARSWFNGRLEPEEIDFDKTWFVMERLLLTGRVEYIFVEDDLLPHLVEAARDYGWTDEAIDRAFLLPEESGYRGIIRHAGGHDSHFHVRFRCPPADDACESY